MTKEQRIDGAAFLAALVCAVTFPHPAGAETGHHVPTATAAAPGAAARVPGVLDSGAWPRR
jgi:2-methylaconitate cis-trans-isomerase PrpF